MGSDNSGPSRGANYLDVDAAFLEHQYQADPIVIRFCGRDWSFPGLMPSTLPLRLARWAADGVDLDNLTIEKSLLIVGDLVPDEYLKAWSDAGEGAMLPNGDLNPKVEKILGHLSAIYFGREAELAGGAGQGEQEAPSAGQNESSGIGPSSKPTSDASTASPSPATSGV